MVEESPSRDPAAPGPRDARVNRTIGATISTVAVASSLAALVLYGLWTLSLRREQLLRELTFEERSLAAVLRHSLEDALEQHDIEEIRDLVERLSTPERIYGLAVHERGGTRVAMSESLLKSATTDSRAAVDEALHDGRERELRVRAGDRDFLVHVLPLRARGDRVQGVAEVWRDLSYIDDYLRQSAVRIVLLMLVLGASITVAVVVTTRRAITGPARELIAAMREVAAGNLRTRVAEGRQRPRGELGDIARAFDRLAEGLEQAKAALDQGARDREELAARLRQSERLATLGQVVAEVAHELGTPLNVISGRAEQLAREVEAQPHALAAARTVSDQARRITKILERLLHVARERMPAFEDVRVVSILRETCGFLAPEAARAGITLHVAGDEKVVARADADLLQQVFVNLVRNAIHAGRRGGNVRLEARRENGLVVLDVIDDGPGVAADMVPRLFDPFATSKPAGRGTGLGLAISRSILQQLGGSLRLVETPPGTGAIFRATLVEPAVTTGVA